MTISPSEIKQVARSREKIDDQPFIDLTALEGDEGIEILEGHQHANQPESSKKRPYFQAVSLQKRHVFLAIGLLLLLILIPSYADRIFRGSTIANGVSISNVDVGGQTPESAKAELQKEAKKAINTPIEFKLGTESISISSQDLDLKYDVDSSIQKAQSIGESYNPISVVSSFAKRYTTGTDIDIKTKYDSAKFDTVSKSIVDTLSKGRADAAVVINGTEVKVIEPKSGKGVSPEQADKALLGAITKLERSPTKLKSEQVEASITLKEAKETAQILNTMFSQNSVLTTPGGNSLTITPAQLSNAVIITPNKSNLDLSIDESKIRASLADQLGAVEVAPVDASFAVSGNTVSVIPSVPGKQIDFNSALENWIKGEHNFQVNVIEKQPSRDTQWAQKLNITEPVSSFTTNFPAGQERVKNIRRAAEVVNNTVVAPGETFSLNAKLGRRTAESGYVKAPVYSDADGFFEDYGGGASQFSTTLFNAAFIGGYKDVTHTPHTIYISRYPMGREATLNYGSIDMAFKNDSNSGVLIRTSVVTTSVTAVIYGNKEGRVVKLEGPVEIGRTPIETNYTDDPTLEIGKEKEMQKGYPGIVVENYRTVDRPGQPGKKERYRWTYNMVPRKVNKGTKPPATTGSTVAPAVAGA